MNLLPKGSLQRRKAWTTPCMLVMIFLGLMDPPRLLTTQSSFLLMMRPKSFPFGLLDWTDVWWIPWDEMDLTSQTHNLVGQPCTGCTKNWNWGSSFVIPSNILWNPWSGTKEASYTIWQGCVSFEYVRLLAIGGVFCPPFDPRCSWTSWTSHRTSSSRDQSTKNPETGHPTPCYCELDQDTCQHHFWTKQPKNNPCGLKQPNNDPWKPK